MPPCAQPHPSRFPLPGTNGRTDRHKDAFPPSGMNGFTNRRYREGIIQFRKYKRRFEKLKGRLERKIAAGTFYRLPLGTRRYLIRRYHRLKTRLERLGVRLLQLGGIAALSLVFAASQAHAGAPNPLELSDLDGSNGFVINGIDPGDGSGGSGSSVGDVNGDGFDDLIIGAYGAAPGGRFGAGESYVIFGGNFTGVIETVTVLTINLNVNGQFEMQFIGVSGVEYVIEHSTDLVNWNTLTTVNGRANSELIVDVDASGEARRFYRVRSQNGE